MPSARPEAPRVLTIAPGLPFLEVLAERLLDGGLIPGLALREDPLLLADTRIYLPTRRAGRALQDVLVRRLGGAALLPRIAPLGDADDDEPPAEDEPAAPRRVPELERRLALAGLIHAWAAALDGAMIRHEPDDALLIPGSPADTTVLAAELARLIDSFATEQVPWTALRGLVPENHDRAWQLIADFLAIAAEAWPNWLAERGAEEAAAARDRDLRALAARLAASPPAAPVIIAGSTGSVPATAVLMAAVARLPLGAVVLPGFDRDVLDEGSWDKVGARDAVAWTHPQFLLGRTVAGIGIPRAGVVPLGAEPDWGRARRQLVATAMRPAETTERWAAETRSPGEIALALAGIGLIEADNEREEALAIAIALRDVLEEPGKTAALVTPDRALARRVIAELARWDVALEDSAGVPLDRTPAGVLARLAAEVAAGGFEPNSLLALLRHPLAGFGLEPALRRRAVDALELGVLRGQRPGPGIAGLRTALDLAAGGMAGGHRHPAVLALGPADWRAAGMLLDRIEAALGPLAATAGTDPPLARYAAMLRAGLAVMCDKPDRPDLAAILELLDGVEAADGRLRLRPGEFPALLDRLLGWGVRRAPPASGSRLQVLGTLEARLLSFDRVVLAGLVEGVWPPQTRSDPWLSRAMRVTIGLPPPEWRVGLSAHDFEQCLGTKEVFLARPARLEGAATVPARWLQRLAAVSGEHWTEVRARGGRFIALARLFDAETPAGPPAEPRPAPPLEWRPARLSITEVETLIRDPYSIYARHVLRLRLLDPVAEPPGAADRGSIIHEALADFVREGVDSAAPDALARLIAIGERHFRPLMDYPDVRALWWPRFGRVARWFLGWEAEHRPRVAESWVEQAARLEWTTAAGRRFTLTGRADRIDRMRDGGFAVLDYKTGAPPTPRQVASGLAPQLPLEAALLAAGAFGEAGPRGAARELVYLQLSGNRVPGEAKPVCTDQDPAAFGADTLARFKHLVNRFEDPAEPYRALIHPMFKRRPNGEYDHLARVAEWSLADDAEESGA